MKNAKKLKRATYIFNGVFDKTNEILELADKAAHEGKSYIVVTINKDQEILKEEERFDNDKIGQLHDSLQEKGFKITVLNDRTDVCEFSVKWA